MRERASSLISFDAFQSAPDREAGRCAPPAPASQHGFVSFNPRPTVRPGDAVIAETAARRAEVSIRARP